MSDSSSQDNEKNKKINVSIPPDIVSGNYSNLMINNFSKEEFILDFALVQPQTSTAIVNSRVVLSPRNAKKLVSLLSTHIQEYEKQCGVILDDSGTGPISFSFN